MATLLGNTSAASLLSAAKSAQSQLESLEDAEATYTWENSAKTQDDLSTYLAHLQSRQTEYKTTNPNKAFTYFSSQTSAQKSFTSSEIQRQNIAVVEGTESPEQKLNKMVGLYKNAVGIGDDSLAQSLRLQIDNYSKTVQDARTAAASALSSTMAATQSRSVADIKAKLIGVPDDPSTYRQNGSGLINGSGPLSIAGVNAAIQKFGDKAFPNGTGLMDVLRNNLEGLRNSYANAAAVVGAGSSHYDTYVNEANNIADGTFSAKLPGLSLSYSDILQYQHYESLGLHPFTLDETNDGFKISKAAVDGMQFVHDQSGQPVMVPKFVASKNINQDTANQIKAVGAAAKKLAGKGVQITANKDGSVTYVNPKTGNQQTGYMLPNGNFEFEAVDNNGTPFYQSLGRDGKLANVSYQEQQAQSTASDYARIAGQPVGSGVLAPGKTAGPQNDFAGVRPGTLGVSNAPLNQQTGQGGTKSTGDQLHDPFGNPLGGGPLGAEVKKKNGQTVTPIPGATISDQPQIAPVQGGPSPEDLNAIMQSHPAYAGSVGLPVNNSIPGFELQGSFGTQGLVNATIAAREQQEQKMALQATQQAQALQNTVNANINQSVAKQAKLNVVNKPAGVQSTLKVAPLPTLPSIKVVNAPSNAGSTITKTNKPGTGQILGAGQLQ